MTEQSIYVEELNKLPHDTRTIIDKYISSVRDVMKKPLQKDEIDHLKNETRKIAVLYSSKDDYECLARYYVTSESRAYYDTSYCTHYCTQKFVKGRNIISYNIDSSFGMSFCHLLGRYDLNVEQMPIYISDGYKTMEFTIILLDIENMFGILQRRCNQASLTKEYAILGTRQFLLEIFNHYCEDPNTEKIITLEHYLKMNMVNLDHKIEVVPTEDTIISPEMIERINQRCKQYLEILIDAINKM